MNTEIEFNIFANLFDLAGGSTCAGSTLELEVEDLEGIAIGADSGTAIGAWGGGKTGSEGLVVRPRSIVSVAASLSFGFDGTRIGGGRREGASLGGDERVAVEVWDSSVPLEVGGGRDVEKGRGWGEGCRQSLTVATEPGSV